MILKHFDIVIILTYFYINKPRFDVFLWNGLLDYMLHSVLLYILFIIKNVSRN